MVISPWHWSGGHLRLPPRLPDLVASCEAYLSETYSYPGPSVPDGVLLVTSLLLVFRTVGTLMAADWWSSQACFFPHTIVRLTNHSVVQRSEFLSATHGCTCDTAAMPAMLLVTDKSLFLSVTCRDLGWAYR